MVVETRETFVNRTGKKGFTGDEYTRSFIVVTDDPRDNVAVVREAPNIPRLGEGYPDDRVYAWAHFIAPTQRDGTPLVWDVGVLYSTDPGEWIENQNPLDRPPDVQWSTETFTEEFVVDQNGVSVKNTANVPFDPPLTRLAAIPVCAVTRNQINFDPSVALQFVPCTNDHMFCGVGESKVLLSSMSGRFEKYGYGGYWQVTYDLKFKLDEDGWEPPVANAGLLEWREVYELEFGEDPNGPDVEKDWFRILVKQRDPLAQPVAPGQAAPAILVPTPEPLPLDFDGRKATPEFLKEHGIINAYFQRYRKANLSLLGLEPIINRTRWGRLPLPLPPAFEYAPEE